MTRPHLAKMAQVKREDARDIQSFRHGDDRCINEAQAIVCVCAYELGRAPRVCNGQSLPVKVALDEGVQEARLRTGAQVSFQEIAHLRKHGHGNKHRVGVFAPEAADPLVMRIAAISQGVKRAAVNQKRH